MTNIYKHLMLDIETMGSQSYSSIVSIGAVEFDLDTGNVGETFYRNINLKSCLDAGLIVNADTIMWRLKQNEEARLALSKDTIELAQALLDFSIFCKNKDYEVWGNSARFDCGILGDAYNKLNLQIPWDFRKERDVRTLVSFAPDIKKNYKYEGVAHNALQDCYNQIGYCTEIWKKLNTK